MSFLKFIIPIFILGNTHCDTIENGSCDSNSCFNYQHQLIIDEDLNNLQQDDPKLIEAIKKIILPIPSKGKKYCKLHFRFQ